MIERSSHCPNYKLAVWQICSSSSTMFSDSKSLFPSLRRTDKNSSECPPPPQCHIGCASEVKVFAAICWLCCSSSQQTLLAHVMSWFLSSSAFIICQSQVTHLCNVKPQVLYTFLDILNKEIGLFGSMTVVVIYISILRGYSKRTEGAL